MAETYHGHQGFLDFWRDWPPGGSREHELVGCVVSAAHLPLDEQVAQLGLNVDGPHAGLGVGNPDP